MTTIRDRQNEEMLSVWKNLNSQVFDRTKRQIAVFPQSVKPKTERDLTVEVNTDKSIEQLNKTFEAKLAALEYLVQLLQSSNSVTGFEGLVKKEDSSAFAQSYQSTTNTGEVIPIWNQIVRYYQQQGLSKDSQEIVKVKTQELKPNLDALTYGIKKAVDFIFQNKNMNAGQALKVMELLRALSIYTMIMTQVDDGSLGLISNFELDTAYKNIFRSLSSNELEILKLYAPRGSITTNAIRNIPDFGTKDNATRLRQIENELGMKFQEGIQTTSILQKLPINELNQVLDRLVQEKGSFTEKSKLTKNEKTFRNKARKAYEELYKAEHNKLVLETERGRLLDEMAIIRYTPIGDVEYNQKEVPETPVEPQPPNIFEDDWYNTRLKYEEDMVTFTELEMQRNNIIEYNHTAKELAEMESVDKKEELIDEKGELVRDIEDQLMKLDEQIELFKINAPLFEKRAKEEVSYEFRRQVSLEVKKLEDKQRFMKPAIDTQAEELRRMGNGKNVDTRGLATLRSNYGKPQSESDSESEESSESDLDFDDARNEHYYTKPKSMR